MAILDRFLRVIMSLIIREKRKREPPLTIKSFYDDLAEYYHLMFQDWDRSIVRQAPIRRPLLEQYNGTQVPKILDCSCDIGTQTGSIAAPQTLESM